ncbi:MAG: HgcAB-associated protein [Deltaproteobacteria bacterium]|nr:HgcAB-associated protein [Deltaproteobacteria bacterium]
MAKTSKKSGAGCCGVKAVCTVETIIAVDERGQMVLPKELRKKASIKAGDRFALASFEKDGKVCCIALIRTDELVGMVKDKLGPVLKEVL